MRRHGQLLEQNFTVATFDQRGTGKSADNLDPTATLTLDRAVSDAIEVTNYLRHRFHQDKIYVVGNSWGTILGVLAVQQHPELYRAFIGAGQMVSPRETDRIFYADTLAWARRTDNTALVDTLTASGPPPYIDILDYEPALTRIDAVYPYDHTPNAEGAGGFSENLFVGEYSLLEQAHNLPAWLDVFAVLYPQLQTIDFRSQASTPRRAGLPGAGPTRTPRPSEPRRGVVPAAEGTDEADDRRRYGRSSEPVRATRPVQPGDDHDRAPTDIERRPPNQHGGGPAASPQS